MAKKTSKPMHGATLVGKARAKAAAMLGILPENFLIVDSKKNPLPDSLTLGEVRRITEPAHREPKPRISGRQIKGNTSVGKGTEIASVDVLGLAPVAVRIVNKNGRKFHKDTTLASVRVKTAKRA